jgi:hypothetical protein
MSMINDKKYNFQLLLASNMKDVHVNNFLISETDDHRAVKQQRNIKQI